MPVLRVSGKTNLLITTRAIISMIHKHGYAEVQALGRFSVHRAEDAILRATRFLEEENITIVSKTWTIMPGVDRNKNKGIRFILRVVDEPLSPPPPAEPFRSNATTPST